MLNNKYKILIIDNNREFNTKLYNKFKEYDYDAIQSFDEKEALNLISQKEFNLIILNIDYDDTSSIEIFDHIIIHSSAKVVLLSKEDIGLKREEYFKHGILDYHMTNRKLDHIVDDIDKSLHRLITNKKETILIIDSSQIMCEITKNLLEQRNYNVITSNTALEGLEIIKNRDISLLLLDMELSDIHGLTLLDKLRELNLLDNFLVMAISDNDTPSIVRDALKGGASTFLKKPFLFEEFLLKIEILVKSSRDKKTTIKQKKQIENSLASFKELVNSTIGSMFIFKKDICIDCNNEAIELLGYGTKKEIIGKGIFDIFNDVTDEHRIKLLDNKTEHDFEDNIISQDGTVFQVQIKERNVLVDSKVLKIIAVMDVTQIKQNDKILNQQSKMASMGEMIGNIAHQWRQPLTAISVAAGGIKLNYEFDMEERDETIKELDNIVENTKFLSSTIENFQNFLKMDRGTQEYNIKDTVKKTLAIIQANLSSYKINIIENYHQDLKLDGIQNDLVQVLLNIVNNASDILKTQNIKDVKKYISIDIDKIDENVVIVLHDTAGGVPDDIINKIFEPYFTTKHQSAGTGLGLYMTHQIITKMAGDIDVKNEKLVIDEKEYFGAKFTIKIPIVG
ncbi:MAG: response regulator [Campylobacterota bacterium]|nr:response regulator [Campylobacterota bacterium]